MNTKTHQKLLVAVGMYIVVGCRAIGAESLVSNGSFEIETTLDSISTMAQYDFTAKNFEFDFDAAAWADSWVINGAMSPAKISFGKRDGGGRYLQIDTSGQSHIFPVETLQTGRRYKASFMARGGDNGKEPRVTVYIYFYNNQGWISNQKLQDFPLDDQWKTYSFDVPDAAPDGASALRIAYEFSGLCEFDDVTVEDAP